MTFFRFIKGWIKRDPVLFAALLLAIGSACVVPPSLSYIGYLDLHVLSLLLSLMLVVAGMQKSGLFSVLIDRLLRFVRNTRALAVVLISVCFFTSMLITNDVALITFVPLTIMVLTQTKQTKHLIFVIVLQTLAANLGSMLTPLGNPQNLYLYSISGLSLGEFFHIMWKPTVVAFVLLLGCTRLLPKTEIAPSGHNNGMRGVTGWVLLFLLCLLAVVHVLSVFVVLAVVVGYVLFKDRKLLGRADYGLLLTFVFFFIFIGNVKNIPAVSGWLEMLIAGRERTVGILLSQIISNVPAAMLLSGFTTNFADLLLGVNLGGMGTLIASMASLISYKIYGVTQNAETGKYLLTFTVCNLAFLAVLWIGVGLF